MHSSVLFESQDRTVVIIDIPRSLEEAQVLPGKKATRQIVSTEPIATPWSLPEPKEHNAIPVSHSAAVADLMALEAVNSALETAANSHTGPWCLERAITPDEVDATQSITKNGSPSHRRKRKHKAVPFAPQLSKEGDVATTVISGLSPPFIPEQSDHLLGTIEFQRDRFLRTAPQFDLIVLDSPWPSRSVKRKKEGYSTFYGMNEAGALLSQIPVAAHLKPDGLVAVWVTNKAAVVDLLTASGGIFDQWGIEPIGEYIWLKITSSGTPIFDVESKWRKPWERLLITRKKGSLVKLPVTPRVILAVPDVHSRKPNLRSLFEDVLPRQYQGLEVFARSLTAGWWSWGDETLLFQQRPHWIDIPDASTGGKQDDGDP
ncbi:MT-A70-domain-containing protein [Xylariaceae sp. FL1272]|nr:MT-A70-domain-containing protein [Xylariaceae sp. FL1272]